MKLPEVLGVLLKAEDQAQEMRKTAEQEAGVLIQKARNKFAQDQEFRLNTAREEARAQVEAAQQSAEVEAQHIAQMGRKSREKMQEHFDEHVPVLISRMAGEIASQYTAQGRGE